MGDKKKTNILIYFDSECHRNPGKSSTPKYWLGQKIRAI